MSKSMAIFFVLFGLAWSAMVVLMDAQIIRQLAAQVRSAKFPVTTGRIVRSEVTTSRGSKGSTRYGFKVQYSYSVGALQYTSDRFRYNEQNFDSGWAYGLFYKYPAKGTAKVYFNPQNPADALLSPGLEGYDIFFLVIVLPFNCAGAGLILLGLKGLMFEIRRPFAGGVKIIDDGLRTRVRLNEVSAFFAAMIALNVSCFLLIFCIGLPTHMRPEMGTVLLAFALVLLVSLIVYGWIYVRIASGIKDLVIDDSIGTVTLPKTCSRKAPQKISRKDIVGVWIEKRLVSGSKGGTTTYYCPTFKMAEANEVQYWRICQNWASQTKAELFCEWLGQKLGVPFTGVENAGLQRVVTKVTKTFRFKI